MTLTASKFDIICNTLDNGIILINKNLEVKFWNKWLEIRTGISTSTIIGKKLTDFYPDIDEKGDYNNPFVGFVNRGDVLDDGEKVVRDNIQKIKELLA